MLHSPPAGAISLRILVGQGFFFLLARTTGVLFEVTFCVTKGVRIPHPVRGILICLTNTYSDRTKISRVPAEAAGCANLGCCANLG